ncbi:sulfatase [Microbacterium awajiense]|uniref:Sulfatase n=1 Tax=Microbacterium awajiense TaxID=415214 RepID=A0ABP7AUB3_9MICO
MTVPMARPADSRPNVLLIVSDQHRYDCVGASEDYPVSTPHIDALARSGVWFDSAFTPIPLCTPARHALITGQRPETTGGLWNYDLGSRIPALEPTAYSWARELQRGGYRTHYTGKWHVHPDHDPTAFGYDEYVALEDYDRWRETHHPEARVRGDWLGGIDPVPTESSRTHWLAARTSEFIREAAAAGGPWHARLDLVEPHLPCLPTEQFAARVDPNAIPQWRSFDDPLTDKPYIQRQQLVNWGIEDFTWDDWAPAVARYYAVIAQMDDAVGSVLRAVAESGAEGNTLVIYTTDHGDMQGSHRMIDKHYVMYDDVVRVPLVMRWPERITAGSRIDAFAYNMLDLAPTIAAATGVSGPPQGHGSDLFAAGSVSEASADVRAREYVVSTYNGQQFGLFTQRMIRTREWKYVWNPTDVDELYDLVGDEREFVNRIDDPACRATVAHLRRALYDQLAADGDHMVANVWMARQLQDGRKLGPSGPDHLRTASARQTREPMA